MGGCHSSAKVLPQSKVPQDTNALVEAKVEAETPAAPAAPKATFFLLGLDGAGKTTVYNTLAGCPDKKAKPTMGASRPLKVSGMKVISPHLYDLSGSSSFRKAWLTRYHSAHGFVFVVDASNVERMPEVRDVLKGCMEHEQFRGKAVLIYANKQDLDGAIDEKALQRHLGLSEGPTACPFKIVKLTAQKASNGGIVDPAMNQGLEWLCILVKRVERCG